MTVLRPLSGDPGTVRGLADRLAAQGEQLLSLAAVVRGLGGPEVSWESPAGTACAERSHAAASLLVSMGRRHAVAAVSLRPLAAALEHAQRVVDAAVAEHEVARPRAEALGNARAEAELSVDPAQRATATGLHCREVAELERARDAERRHAEAWRQFDEADRRCAGVLRALVHDGLADSRTYDALTGLSRAAGGVAEVAGSAALVPLPATKPLGVLAAAGEGVAVFADTTVKVAYGDGDWTSIGLSAVTTAAGPASRVLRRGALATNPAARSAPTRAERRLLRYDVGERLRLGVVAEARRAGRAGAERPPRVFRPTRRPGSPAAAAHWVAELVTARARHAARVRWLDDLELATRDPARSRRMLLTAFGAEATAAGSGGAGALRERFLDREQSEATRLRDARHEGAGPQGPATHHGSPGGEGSRRPR